VPNISPFYTRCYVAIKTWKKKIKNEAGGNGMLLTLSIRYSKQRVLNVVRSQLLANVNRWLSSSRLMR